MLGQVMELEIEIPIWWVYLAFPTGFGIMTLFATELMLVELNMRDLAGVVDVHLAIFSQLLLLISVPFFWSLVSAARLLLSLAWVCLGQL